MVQVETQRPSLCHHAKARAACSQLAQVNCIRSNSSKCTSFDFCPGCRRQTVPSLPVLECITALPCARKDRACASRLTPDGSRPPLPYSDAARWATAAQLYCNSPQRGQPAHVFIATLYCSALTRLSPAVLACGAIRMCGSFEFRSQGRPDGNATQACTCVCRSCMSDSVRRKYGALNTYITD